MATASNSNGRSLQHVSKKRKIQEAALQERRRRENERIAELLDTPTKKYGSTRRLGAGRRSQQAAEASAAADAARAKARAIASLFSCEDSDSELSSESEPEEDHSEDSEGEEEVEGQDRRDSEEESNDDDDSDSVSSAPNESTFDSSDDDDNSGSDEDTAVTSDEDFDEADTSDEEWEGEGGKRKRRGGNMSTPRGKKQARYNGQISTTGQIATTPRARERILGTVTSTPHLPARPLNMVTLSVDDLQGLSPQARAKKLLHVGATPERLPCREDQYEEVLACVEDAVQDGIGGCVYVSGVPGVGKTATVREAIRSLKYRAKAGLIAPFRFVEVNGMKLNDTQDAYSLLWQTVSGGERCSNRTALQRLSHHFSGNRKRMTTGQEKKNITTVVLMDELDQLVTTRQEVMYNMFNWPNSQDSGLIVIAVANTMDLPERILNPKVASRLGMTRITFKPYNDKQLVEIVSSRLGIGRVFPEDQIQEGDLHDQSNIIERALLKDCDKVFSSDAIVFVSKRVSNVSGDARRMLDVCRRAIDSVEMMVVASQPSNNNNNPTIRQVTINDVKKVLDSMVKSGKVSHIIKLSLHAKVALIATLACARRSGVAEIDFGAILAHHRTLCHMQHISTSNSATASSSTIIDARGMAAVMAQLCSLGLLIAVGNGAGNARGGIHARFLLACQEDEVRLALEQDPDSRLRRML